MPRLDIDRASLTVVEPGREIDAGSKMGMIEAQSGGAGRERDAAHAMRRDERGFLFRRAIHFGRHELPVPMQLFRCVGVVMDVDDDGLAVGQSQQRAGELPIIGLCRDRCIPAEFNEACANAECVVCRCRCGQWAGWHRACLVCSTPRRSEGHSESECRDPARSNQLAAIKDKSWVSAAVRVLPDGSVIARHN